MAKVVGLVGSARGKIGNIVYAVTNGIQVARVYQPVVQNPKSPLQNAQRAKGNLAGRISSLTPRAAIFGLGANARQRRGEFLRNLLNAASVTSVGGVYTAKISDADVLFSKGAVPLSVTSAVSSVDLHTLAVDLTGINTARMDADTYAGMQTRIVVLVYDSTSLELIEVHTQIAIKPAQSATERTLVNITTTGGRIAVVYAIPMSTADRSAITITTDMATKDDANIAAELSANRNAIEFEYGKSVVIGTSTYVPEP